MIEPCAASSLDVTKCPRASKIRTVPSCTLETVRVIPFAAILNVGFTLLWTKVVVEEDDSAFAEELSALAEEDDTNTFELEEILISSLDEDSIIKPEELLDMDSELEDSSNDASDEDDD